MGDFPKDAFWIGSNHAFDLHEAYLCFRREWESEGVLASSILNITADSRYKLWVNGQFVARGPNRCFPQAQIVDQLAITPYLQAGKNTIAVQVYSPGYSHFAYVHRGAAGLLAWLDCDGEIPLVTDTTWRTWRDPSFDPNVPRVSIYGTGVEKRDMRQVVAWQATDYDDSGWEVPRIFAPIDGDPWESTQLRRLPLLLEREQPLTLIESRKGATVENPDPHLALRQGWLSATPQQQVDSRLRGSDRTQENDSCAGGHDLKAGESAYFLYDLGRDFSCQGWAEVTGADGTESVAISYAEKIRADDILISDPETYCRVRLTDHFQLRPGDQTVEGYTFRGGRYLLFQVTGPTGAGFQLTPHVRVSEYPLVVKTPLQTGDSELDGIVTFCETTFNACLQDGFVDSTWRESSQWLGDALPQSLIMASMTDDVRPLKQVIEMAMVGAYPDGVFPSVLPGEVHAYAVVDYNFMWVELLQLYYNLTQDRAFLASMWQPLLKMMNRFHEDLAADGLIRSQAGRRLFLDWSPVSRNEPNAIYNFRYLLGLQVAEVLAGVLGENAGIFHTRATQLQQALRTHFWQNNRWYDDLERTTFSQQSAAFALLTGTENAGTSDQLLNSIIARSLDLNDTHTPGEMVLASPFTHHYIFEALRKFGRHQAALDIIRQRWGRWVKAGYPTAWENWNVDFPDGSQCHAFSAHPRYHLAKIFEEMGDKT